MPTLTTSFGFFSTGGFHYNLSSLDWSEQDTKFIEFKIHENECFFEIPGIP